MRRAAVMVPVPLCRFAGHTCAACCRGERVSRPALHARLLRQTRQFARRFAGRPPTGLGLLLHELSIRGAADTLWGLLLAVPVLGDLLRPILKRRLTCAFLGYEDSGHTRVGCMLHPSRWAGRDMRRHAFALLPGVTCGAADYYCPAAHAFAAAAWPRRADFERRTRGFDWHAYSRAAAAFRPQPRDIGEKGGRSLCEMR